MCFPSKDFIDICCFCERIFREKIMISSEIHHYERLSLYECHKIVSSVLSVYLNRPVFQKLSVHMKETDALHNHLVLLIKAVA